MGDFISLLLLLGIANGVPVLATRVAGSRFNAPVDGGLTLADGRRLFGASKTIRGIAASVIVTSIAAHVLGFAWTVGFVLGAGAMVGDLAASFVKRRVGLEIHGRAPGLDQIPEAALPLLLLRGPLNLSWLSIVGLVAAFVVVELVLSRILYTWGIRDRPY